MTRFFLIRHAAIDGLGERIAGRSTGLPLNASGQEQAVTLAERLRRAAFDAIYSSPQRRALETAEALARNLELPLEIAPELDEIDFGEWTGKSYAELGNLPRWREFNLLHSSTRIPGGELLLEAQVRVITFMDRLCARHPEKTIALVSHGDVIRAALAHQLGIPLDFILRFDIGPASTSALEWHPHGPRVLWINNSAEAC